MSIVVPYLKKEVIEREAALVLAEYGQVATAPVPIDEIVELHLKLTLEIMDLQQIFGFGDVHGAIWFQLQRVGIDQSLDPVQNPAKRGRYRFTLGHEAGHWRLHRHLYLRRMDQPLLFPDENPRPSYVCRSSEAKVPVESQADQFAANLLMPRELVKKAWQDWRGNLEPIVLTDLHQERDRILAAEVNRRGAFRANDDEMVLENCCRPLADMFQVSAKAMRIRLEDMGFLLRQREVSLFT